MKKYLVFILTVFLTWSITAKEKRNLLSGFYTRKWVNEAIISDLSWIAYPSYYDRKAWENLSSGQRDKTIGEGEKYLDYSWPVVTASMYLEFTRTGDRSVVDSRNNERKRALLSLAMAELMEGKGRFLDDLVNGVFAFCEQTYWGSSAHFYLYGFEGSIANPVKTIPDIEDPVIDLVVGDTASDLAWIWYFFHQEFDKISPVISQRLKDELKTKVLEPFYSRYDFWWITGWDEGRVNNWNPWCNYNMLACILLIEDDSAKKQTAIYKTMESVDLFINSYPADGGCDEGPSYWGVAGGKLFDYLSLLHLATKGKIDIFSNELIKNMGRYIYRVYISNGDYYINFADAPFRIRHDPARIYRFGRNIDDPDLKGFGVFLMQNSGFGNSAAIGRMGETLEALFNTSGWETESPVEPLLSHYYFPDLDIALGRDRPGSTRGFYFAAKGGSNGEGHNHNDVGSFMLYYNGDPVLIDVGVGTYTRETFSDKRYTIWTMQSDYHNVPMINGFSQSPGGRFKATGSSFSIGKNRVHYSTNIACAYPAEAKVDKWIRSYLLERGTRFIVSDNFALSENVGGTASHFMTALNCKIVRTGVVELEGNGFKLYMNYNPKVFDAKIETVAVNDRRLAGSLGDKVYRLVFLLTDQKLTDNYSFEIIQAK